ncbi:hypothetical protein [Dethiosulfatarculus sandiegensis]|uniref:Cytoplasmic protein n=1 Tax=Dethiosulfatarculus sandiegensis TaxID=1429043 RepID=A0A0D2JCD9_9BACT|nr:hypothetical protein [Dethiosulfatarculus sandiegensis]KIX15809.1 hypothetical protein X474_00320 [Dethiosulfatarculus sandiegensis]
MKDHTHDFVEDYTGLVGYGLDRDTDEATVQFYLQKFSDDVCMRKILPRMEQKDLDTVFELISELLRKHFSEPEYHAVFLKDESHGS